MLPTTKQDLYDNDKSKPRKNFGSDRIKILFFVILCICLFSLYHTQPSSVEKLTPDTIQPLDVSGGYQKEPDAPPLPNSPTNEKSIQKKLPPNPGKNLPLREEPSLFLHGNGGINDEEIGGNKKEIENVNENENEKYEIGYEYESENDNEEDYQESEYENENEKEKEKEEEEEYNEEQRDDTSTTTGDMDEDEEDPTQLKPKLPEFIQENLHFKLPPKTEPEENKKINDKASDLQRFAQVRHLSELEKRKQIVEEFKHSWNGYREHAWGSDELIPMTNRSKDGFGMGLTLVDGLDTAYIMGLKDIVEEARQWIEESLIFYKPGKRDVFTARSTVNVFETTIRILGGLLSCYHLSNYDQMYLEKATDLGDLLLGAFETKTGIPVPSIDLSNGRGVNDSPDRLSSSSEVGTIQLEFKYLSLLSQNPKYTTRAELASQILNKPSTLKLDGLIPIYISSDSGNFNPSEFKLGARGDSYYEYLLKMTLFTEKIIDNDKINIKNSVDVDYKHAWSIAKEGIKKHLVSYSFPNKLTYISEMKNSKLSPKMDHLVCFLPGVLVLGVTKGISIKEYSKTHTITQDQWDDLKLAEDLMYTCWKMYDSMASGLAPEIVHFSNSPGATEDIIVKPADTHNLLRPETVESLFILYRITGNTTYQEWGWKIFEAFKKQCRVESGYTPLDNVTLNPARKRSGKMESFWLAETLKYLYLLFSDPDVIPLDKYVFNTEAHPFPIPSKSK